MITAIPCFLASVKNPSLVSSLLFCQDFDSDKETLLHPTDSGFLTVTTGC